MKFKVVITYDSEYEGYVVDLIGKTLQRFREGRCKDFSEIWLRIDHQTGSHIILYHESKPTLSIPDHKELAPGLLRGLIRKSGLTVDEFLRER
jgi:hypothetical protein